VGTSLGTYIGKNLKILSSETESLEKFATFCDKILYKKLLSHTLHESVGETPLTNNTTSKRFLHPCKKAQHSEISPLGNADRGTSLGTYVGENLKVWSSETESLEKFATFRDKILYKKLISRTLRETEKGETPLADNRTSHKIPTAL
jgi:hypothetical protein